MNAPTLSLTSAEFGLLKVLMRDGVAYDGLVQLLDDQAVKAMHVVIYGNSADREFRAGYAAALLHVRETLVQAKTKVYSAP